MATRDVWAKRVEQWRKSGLSAADFSAREGIKSKQLVWWRWKLRSLPSEPAALGSPQFLPVRVVDAVACPFGAIASGVRLPRIQAIGLSDKGMLRPTNEDAYAVLPDLGLFMVSDGIGGRASGEVASRMAVDSVREAFAVPALARPSGTSLRSAAAGLTLLRAGVEHANACVHAESIADPTKSGMGTTLSALLVLEDTAALAHVGDSRIYGLRRRRFEQLTEDHTLARMLMHAGVLRREDARESEHHHTLVRAIGTDESVDVDTRLVALSPGDTFLLASDGLHGVLDDATMAAILLREEDLTVAAARLVDRANELGGPDNISVVLVRVG